MWKACILAVAVVASAGCSSRNEYERAWLDRRLWDGELRDLMVPVRGDRIEPIAVLHRDGLEYDVVLEMEVPVDHAWAVARAWDPQRDAAGSFAYLGQSIAGLDPPCVRLRDVDGRVVSAGVRVNRFVVSLAETFDPARPAVVARESGRPEVWRIRFEVPIRAEHELGERVVASVQLRLDDAWVQQNFRSVYSGEIAPYGPVERELVVMPAPIRVFWPSGD